MSGRGRGRARGGGQNDAAEPRRSRRFTNPIKNTPINTTIRFRQLPQHKLDELEQLEQGTSLSTEEEEEFEELKALWAKGREGDSRHERLLENQIPTLRPPPAATAQRAPYYEHAPPGLLDEKRKAAAQAAALELQEDGLQIDDAGPASAIADVIDVDSLINDWLCEVNVWKVPKPEGGQPRAEGAGDVVKKEPTEGEEHGERLPGAEDGYDGANGELGDLMGEDAVMEDNEEEQVADELMADADGSPGEQGHDEDTDQQDGAFVADDGPAAAVDRVPQNGCQASAAAAGEAPDSPVDVDIVPTVAKQETDAHMPPAGEESTVHVLATMRSDLISHPSRHPHLPRVKTEADGTTTPIPSLAECHRIAKDIYQQQMAGKAFKALKWRVAREIQRCLLSAEKYGFHAWRWARWCERAVPGSGEVPDWCQLDVFRQVEVRLPGGDTEVWQMNGAERVYMHSQGGVEELIDITTTQDQADAPVHIKEEPHNEGEEDEHNDALDEGENDGGAGSDQVPDNTPPPPDTMPPADQGAPASPVRRPAAPRPVIKLITMEEWQTTHRQAIYKTFVDFCRSKVSSSSNAQGAYKVAKYNDPGIWRIEPRELRPGMAHPHVIKVTFALNETATISTDWLKKRAAEPSFERLFRTSFDRWFRLHKAVILRQLGENLLPQMPRDSQLTRNVPQRARDGLQEAPAAATAAARVDAPELGHGEATGTAERIRKRKERRRMEKERASAAGRGVAPLIAVKTEPGVEQAAPAVFRPVPIKQEPTDEPTDPQPPFMPRDSDVMPLAAVDNGVPPLPPPAAPAAAKRPRPGQGEGDLARGVSLLKKRKKRKTAKKKGADTSANEVAPRHDDGEDEGEEEDIDAMWEEAKKDDSAPIPHPPLSHHPYFAMAPYGQPPPPPYPGPLHAHDIAGFYSHNGWTPPSMAMPPHMPHTVEPPPPAELGDGHMDHSSLFDQEMNESSASASVAGAAASRMWQGGSEAAKGGGVDAAMVVQSVGEKKDSSVDEAKMEEGEVTLAPPQQQAADSVTLRVTAEASSDMWSDFPPFCWNNLVGENGVLGHIERSENFHPVDESIVTTVTPPSRQDGRLR
ncbi:unnamed protein product [Vitrella brassicaformis CCMP3155]|uniref:Uncharacterized protein n=1 Tax=Vitrella brassicaformis (strain CCMP3155) TaxID=1169540 RepID=A0A0G4EBG0_VITBC|nr:unnamed protein product [Vitrella brassicaformis CCMP3155]|eukprot:CEL92616.1 unnamed protein product [Vitrella brassicaformis CCMP3155]